MVCCDGASVLVKYLTDMLHSFQLKIRRNLPNPFNPAVLHLPAPADALGDRLGDDRLLELLVFLDGRAGLLDNSVDAGALGVEEIGYAALLR